ncbi:hypothetical protein C6500_12510 [Candidatus Poribacteria bacterium]|nr:MAG: hypothetical protein C6500_12510 [Candidatus Poribacteria bacterium]
MDDGKVIEHEEGSDTFVAVIEVFGIEQVHALKLGTERHPLVSRKTKGEDPGKHRKSDTSDSYSIYTTFSTEDKLSEVLEARADAWDKQIEEDIKAGRLEHLRKEALEDIKAGRFTDLFIQRTEVLRP